MNLPNSITLIRICGIPLLIWILSSAHFSSENGAKELLASAIFIAASMTDGIDGYRARKRGQITTMGILLDPMADKLLIAAAFVTLVQFNPSLVPAWIAVIIIGREFLVSGLRSIAASGGFTIEASELGKFKMVVQIVSVVAVILDHRWKEWPVYGNFVFPIHWIAYLAIWFVVCVSLVSAIDYFAAFWSKIDRRVSKRRRRAFILSRRKKPPNWPRQMPPLQPNSSPKQWILCRTTQRKESKPADQLPSRSSLPRSVPCSCGWRTIPFLRRWSGAQFLWSRPPLILPSTAARSRLCICADNYADALAMFFLNCRFTAPWPKPHVPRRSTTTVSLR